MVTSFSIVEVSVLIGYLTFSVWTAYTSGYNMALMKRHAPRGAGKYGPYLGQAAAYIGIAAMVFLIVDMVAYEAGFLRADLPVFLSSLNFFSFLLRQFGSVRFASGRYIAFIAANAVSSIAVSFLVTRRAYNYGRSRIEGPS